ncbi:MAG: tetratricopeptide repeat protein [Cyanobacteria bacterium SIG31]|nr:tetratricopeptide repeat protein [Cyanobacteria bacterium SIG31]
MKLAEQLELNEKYDEAYAEYKKELPHKSGDVELLTKLAHLALILEKKDEAKIYYGKILEVDPANILAHEQLIDLFVNEDKFKYYLFRGNLHSLQQQYSHAKSDYKKAIDNAKDQEEALPARYLYAGLAEQQEKLQEAIDEYLRISDYDEKNPIVFLKLAELYEKTEGIIASIEILERGYKENGFKEFEEILAGYYIRNSQPDKAINLTKNDLTKARALMDLGKNDEAFEILNRVKDNYKGQALIHSLLAQYYFQKGMSKEAFAEIEEYAKIEPNSPLIYQMKALIYESLNDSFNEHINWGKFNILKGEKEVALNEYMTAYQFDNKNIDLIETIAGLLENLKDQTKACEFYERLTELEPSNANALEKLAIFRDSIGDYSGAFEYIDRLKTVAPRNQFVAENYDSYKDRAENGGSFMSFFKSIFGKRMG